ncbi:SIR2 family protein [Ralstonia solanacearum]|uniref:SIR2 family NAD-dependent protein deacylase n=1 Tax=Ralstonia solanacearum TaxID=305 RepID=UPI002304E59A|nr:SIR2 family protein [Ralstonia solanacearum]MDB0511545.1 SIR2 family protein [Ralstonia solanacearum]MDB0516175.1 SIR2 family protein [Ralstonia solanacearum]
MHELLPDAGVTMPSNLHMKLLSLNWSDVYTTNYDTLLERALDTDRRAFIPKITRRYQVVVAAEDVPFSKSNGRPRLVKLHGSLRTGSRLIVTEEDYRSYPSNFAPFVNTVQQSMLENVFCLLGFSGDDPNFLAWTGWVRDRLGDKTPPIYLITLKPVQEGQRLTLERRNVFPIDIGQLGKSEGKSSSPAAAIEALFDFWADSAPPRRANWPYQRPMNALATSEPTIEHLRRWTTSAQQNRGEYPGWLLAPADNRARLEQHSGLAMAGLAYRRHRDTLPAWFRLVFLREAAWILDTALSPIGSHFADDIERALEQFMTETASSPLASQPENWEALKPTEAELRTISAHLAVVMQRDARETSSTLKFDLWTKTLRELPKLSDAPEACRLAIYEQVLQNLERQQRGEAFHLLEQLDLVDVRGDLYWPIRIGALYAELGWVTKGRERVRTGLHAIREAIQFEGETTYLVSREQWAERLLDGLNFAAEDQRSHQRTESSVPVSQKPVPTPEVSLRETVPREEDVRQSSLDDEEEVYRDINARSNIEHPNSQVEILLQEIKAADNFLQHITVGFDSNQVLTGYGLPHLRPEAFSAALAFCRLVEITALVPNLGGVGLSGRDLGACYRILAATGGGESSLRVMFRANNGAAISSLGLAQVDQLSRESALEIFHRSLKAIDKTCEGDDGAWDNSVVSALRVALDLSSRVAFRLGLEHALVMLDYAVKLYVFPKIQESISLHDDFSRFVQRAMRLTSKVELENFSDKLLPLSPENPGLIQRSTWPNIVDYLNSRDLAPEPGSHWHSIADAILEKLAASQSNDSAGSYGCAQLDWLYRHKLMTAGQVSRFGALIWRDSNGRSLPNVPGFYRGAVLAWPAPANRRVSNTFRDWLRQESIESIVTLREVDGKTRRSISSVRESYLTNVLLSANKSVSLTWTRDDLLAVVEQVMRWWRDEGADLMAEATKEAQRDFAKIILSARLRLIAHVMHRVVSPRISSTDSEAQRISDWLSELWDSGLRLNAPLIPLLFAGLSWWPERSTTVVDIMASLLAQTKDRVVTSAALNAGGHWLLSQPEESDATRRYVTYLVAGVSSQSVECLDIRLSNVAELLRLGAGQHFEMHYEALARSLCLLLHELQDYQSTDEPVGAASKPILRRAVVSVLAAMGNQLPQTKQLDTWEWAMQQAEKDNLLIVRNLLGEG